MKSPTRLLQSHPSRSARSGPRTESRLQAAAHNLLPAFQTFTTLRPDHTQPAKAGTPYSGVTPGPRSGPRTESRLQAAALAPLPALQTFTTLRPGHTQPAKAGTPYWTPYQAPCWATVLTLLVALAISPNARAADTLLQLPARSQVATATSNEWATVITNLAWSPRHSAVVICDMWDKHWCPDATARVGEMAPVMNRVVEKARQQGVFIIHCPSDTLEFYRDHPGRKLAQAAPKVTPKVPLQGWCSLQPGREAPLPIDDSDGGCDGCPDCQSHRAWKRQHPAIEIAPGDAITDSAEAYYLMRERGITNVIVMGVHANMCVLGRPFSIRQMVRQGQNVVLMRDLTDSMYNHRRRPYVSHFAGTDLIVDHIEKYWCPSITSAAFLGGEPFRFRDDVRKRIVMIIGENEYQTDETLPAFARQELAWRGFDIDFVRASSREGDGNFTNHSAIARADLLVISVRRRTPPAAMLDLIRSHIASGRAVVGLRTASHAFDAPVREPGHAAWTGFDMAILGGNYQGHYNNKPPKGGGTVISLVASNATHPVLTGIKAPDRPVTSHLYKYPTLAATAVPLVMGKVADRPETEPVAWVNPVAGRRIFYTSLGSPDDFKVPMFRRLLLNGILWSLNEPVPPAP